MAKRKSTKRELIETGGDKCYIRRDTQGQIRESDDVGRSLSRDRKTKSKTATRARQGDKVDRRRSK